MSVLISESCYIDCIDVDSFNMMQEEGITVVIIFDLYSPAIYT